MTDKNKEKYQTLAGLLEDEYALVHLNPIAEELLIPEEFYKDPSVTLKLSYHFSGSMYLHDDRVVAQLRFANVPFECVIPFSAIWGMTSSTGKNMVWPEAAPAEVFKILLAGVSNIQQPGGQVEEKKESPLKELKQVKAPKEKGSEKKGSKKGSKKKERPTFLKRVK